MNIFKAILLTALLLAIEVLIGMGIYEFIEPSVTDSLSSDKLIHFTGIADQTSIIISYVVVFLLSFKTTFHWNTGFEKITSINLYTISFLLIITIGLEFFDRPFFDFSKIFNYFRYGELEQYEFTLSSNLPWIYRGFSALIIAPIFEELFFRKFIFGELLKKYSLNISIVCSSICFSLIHLPNYRNLLPTFIFGITSCLIYINTKNIIYSIILHFFVNLSWLSLLVFGNSFYKWTYGLEFNFIYWSFFILGLILWYFGIKKITAANDGSRCTTTK